MATAMNINIFNYTDYRLFLRDAYQELKSENTKISHRYIARKVGFSSSGLFSQIIKMQTNISNRLVVNFTKFFKLNKKEAEYFELLVQYNQAKSHEETKYFYEKILSFRRPRAKKIEVHQYEYLNKWYYVAIRQLLAIYPFKGDYKKLAKMVVPAIKPSEAEKAIQLLTKLKLITKDAQGYFKWVDPTITTGEKSDAVGIQSYLRDTMDMAKHALDKTPRVKRKISTLTMSISQNGLDAIEERTKAYRKEVQEIAEKDGEVDRVYQLNIQFFPMSQTIGGGDE
jgi:uncharacterized protein (TIGR02147 family)